LASVGGASGKPKEAVAKVNAIRAIPVPRSLREAGGLAGGIKFVEVLTIVFIYAGWFGRKAV
jgi:hypothetical protein